MSDVSELLRDYAERGSPEAFAMFARENIHFIYSIAMLRSGKNACLSSEVTQNVLISASRRAAELSKHPTLERWLYAATSCAVVDLKRAQKRQEEFKLGVSDVLQAGETLKSVEEQVAIHSALSAEFDCLGPEERDSILLRYLHGMDFAAISSALGVPEKTVRTRVRRALNKLKSSFAARGIASTSALVESALAQSRIKAPVGLLKSLLQSRDLVTVSVIGKGFLASGVAVAIGSAAVLTLLLFPTRLRSHQLTSSIPIGASAPARLSSIAPDGRLIDEKQNKVLELIDDGQLLRRLLDETPDERIPEINLLEDDYWESIAKVFSPHDPSKVPSAFTALRSHARVLFAVFASAALKRYAVEHSDVLPKSIDELAPFLPAEIPASLLNRYTILRTGEVSQYPLNERFIGETGGVQTNHGDTLILFGVTPRSMTIIAGSQAGIQVRRATIRYVSEHDGAFPTNPAELSEMLSPKELAEARADWTAYGRDWLTILNIRAILPSRFVDRKDTSE